MGLQVKYNTQPDPVDINPVLWMRAGEERSLQSQTGIDGAQRIMLSFPKFTDDAGFLGGTLKYFNAQQALNYTVKRSNENYLCVSIQQR